MIRKGDEEDEFLDTENEPITEIEELRSGGCAGIDEIGWSQKFDTNLSLEELQTRVELIRQKLLKNQDVKKVKNALIKCGISESEQLIALVKRYNFDSPGIAFTPNNYHSWTKLANGNGTINDARYLVHEIAEVNELRRIQQQKGFDFMGSNKSKMTRKQKQQWKTDFDNYYMQAHSKALDAEYDFIATQVSIATNDKVSISRIVAAAIDPNREEARLYMLVEEKFLKDHPNFNTWQLRGKEIVELNRNQRIRLKFIGKPKPTLADLVRTVKQIKLNSL